MDVIIGAGITGLTYANFTRNPYVILEASNHIGGLCNTIKKDGFVWDYSGHFFHFQDPTIAKFIKERLDETGLIRVDKHTQIKYKDRLIDFPFQKNIHQLSKKEFIDCLFDLFNVQQNTFLTFKEMLYSKFGKSIAEKFLIPYNQKLYATDLNVLDADAMGRFFPYADKEDIILNFKKSNNDSYNGSFLYHKGGAIEYVHALERDIEKSSISLNENVISINYTDKTVLTNKRKLNYDNLISTIPFVQLLKMCDIEYDKQSLSWNKVLVYNLGFDKQSSDTKNHWIYFPENKYCFYRVGFYNNIVSSERMSLYIEIGLKPEDDVNVNDKLQQVLNDLRVAGIVSDQNLISWHSVIMNPAYVHISQKGIEEVKKWKSFLSAKQIYSIGRYGSWNYSSIEDNMKEAIQLSDLISMHKS
ncbi:MAG: FAD-dependent oxidoreductase [Paludibacteraceae bacterium]|nr:FAD-dependent oxidoreductase [Paludibacteraceae bacterium]